MTGTCSRLLALVAAVSGIACGGGEPSAPPATELTLAVSAEVEPGPFTAGQSYFGRNGYIEYIAGNSPVIYTAPHGGALSPAAIPDRTTARCGEAPTTSVDLNTADLVRRMQQAHVARFGTYPHVVINHLHRRKLDANRPLGSGACGDADAAAAWEEWHQFIAAARSAIVAGPGRGWYMDIHGHGHTRQRLELGYLTTGAQLRLSDAALDGAPAHEDTASFSTLSRHSALTFSALLRGGSSLGAFYAANAFPAVPSADDPGPAAGDEYFSGGYNTSRHGCGVEATTLGGTGGGSVCGVQLEANFTGVRDSEDNRQRFAEVTAAVMEQYLGTHWGLQLGRTNPATAPVVARGGANAAASAKLTWSGSSAGSIDVHRDGTRVTTVANTGSHVDHLGAATGTFSYRVCEAGTSRCSNTASVTF